MMSGLRIAPNLLLPEEAVTETFAILAKRGKWRDVLKAGARSMLDHLVAIHPTDTSRDELAAAVDMTATGGTFQTYLGTLRRNGLVEVDDGIVRASDALFLDGSTP